MKINFILNSKSYMVAYGYYNIHGLWSILQYLQNINVNVIVHELKACITQYTISEEQMKYVYEIEKLVMCSGCFGCGV